MPVGEIWMAEGFGFFLGMEMRSGGWKVPEKLMGWKMRFNFLEWPSLRGVSC